MGKHQVITEDVIFNELSSNLLVDEKEIKKNIQSFAGTVGSGGRRDGHVYGVLLTNEILDDLQAISIKLGITKHKLIRAAIMWFLSQYKSGKIEITPYHENNFGYSTQNTIIEINYTDRTA